MGSVILAQALFSPAVITEVMCVPRGHLVPASPSLLVWGQHPANIEIGRSKELLRPKPRGEKNHKRVGLHGNN